MKAKLLKYLKYAPSCVFAIGAIWSSIQNESTYALCWFLLWFVSWLPFQFPKEDYIKACAEHFEVMRGKEVVQSILYSEIGMICLTREYATVRSPKFGSKWRDAALISLHSPNSGYLQNMKSWSAMKRKHIDDDNIYVSIPFVSTELFFLMEKTLCNLYITEEMYTLYEQDLYALEHPFGARIYICFENEHGTGLTTLKNYRQHILNQKDAS